MNQQTQAPFIRTVTGDIPPDQVGVCYAHEHLIIDAGFATHANPDFLLDDVAKCVAELQEVFDLGVRTMVDSMPMACGRNVLKLADVSKRSGMQILCPTGIHLSKYYPPGHWSTRLDEETLSQHFVSEITDGIDANDGNGPHWQASSHRAGLIKVAGGLDRLDDQQRVTFKAAAQAHVITGAPILTHTEQGTAAMEQLELLRDHGVDLKHVVLSHLDRKSDVAYHRDVLQSGVCLEYDSAFRWKVDQVADNPTMQLLTALLADFPDQLMLGMDAARRSYWKQYGGKPGLHFLYQTWVSQMQQVGISDQHIQRLFIDNPAQAYRFCPNKEDDTSCQ
ncbi:MAG: aryldialkylphosphatase [Phycisphaeraceae bacterium]|nr:aryldialkylphosphatase [Phycisphaeraceae bacterium]